MNSEDTPSVALPASPCGRFATACRVLDEAIDARAFPGCAFGVLAGSEVVLLDARGRFTYDEASPAVTPETVYDVASITKIAATTATVMLLHQRGLLRLETPLSELLPGFVVTRAPGDPARRVTLRHLLAHNSGLPGYVEFFRTAATPDALLRACLELSLKAESASGVLRSRLHSAGQGARSADRRSPRALGAARNLSASGLDGNELLPSRRGAKPHSAHRGGHYLPPSPHSGRGPG
jgi:CubicO group peptidase (beta-lactamase class C family)